MQRSEVLKFIAISDTHGCHRQLDLPVGDVLIHAGDVCDRGNQDHVDDFFDWFASLPFRHKLLIWGNHDFDIAQDQLLFPKTIPAGITVLNGAAYKVGSIKLFGVPTPATKRGEDWASIPEDTDILITHRPPSGILDVSRLRGSQGSRGLAKRVKAVRPGVHLFGHIHHSHGQSHNGETQFFNTSLYKASRKRLVNQPTQFEWPLADPSDS